MGRIERLTGVERERRKAGRSYKLKKRRECRKMIKVGRNEVGETGDFFLLEEKERAEN